jgi:hypothetical protein
MSSVVEPRLAAWLRTTIATDLTAIKRKNYFQRLMTAIEVNEANLRASATWPRLPIDWTRYRDYEASRHGGMPWPMWSVYNHAYTVAAVSPHQVGSFLRALTEFAQPSVERGSLFSLFLWVAWTAERAWIFIESAPAVYAWTSGEHWIERWPYVDEVVWVEWSTVTDQVLRVLHQTERASNHFVPDSSPPHSDWPFAPSDDKAMRAWLASGPLAYDPATLPTSLVHAVAAGKMQLRLVPTVFESRCCFPGEDVHPHYEA